MPSPSPENTSPNGLHDTCWPGATRRTGERYRLSDHATFKSHGHHINRDEARAIGLTIDDLEGDQVFQDLVLSVYHATTHTFNGTAAVKIIENQNGRAYIKLQGVPVQPPPHAPVPPPTP